MSLNPMGDAQPQAVAGTSHTLPISMVDNAGKADGVQAPDQPPEPEADSGTKPLPAAAAEPATEPAADTATEPETATEPAAEAEPEPDEPDARAEALAIAYAVDETEPTDLIEMSEPVELAEPVEERPRRRRGHGLLLGGVFFLAALAIIGGAFAVVGKLTHGFKKPVVITYKKSAVFSLRTGECIDPNGQAASLVPCTAAHEAEVFATFALPASKWPGEAGVRAAASAGCAGRLTGYLNPQLAISLATTYVYPDSVAWQAGTRTVICEVRATSGDLTGSVRGASAT
jgi:Septum formation